MMNRKLSKKMMSTILGGAILASTSAVLAAPMTLTLDQSVDLAMKNNRTIKQSEYSAENAEWGLKAAKGQSGFNISWQGQASKITDNGPKSPLTPQIDKAYSNTLTATVPLYTGGKLENAIKAQDLGAQISRLQLEATRQQIKFQVTKAYYQVLQAQNYVKVSKQAQDQIAEHLKVVNAMYSAGVVAKSDVLRSEVELANAQQRLVSAENTFENAKSALDNLIGLPMDTELTLKDNLAHEPFTKTLTEVIATALANRPDVAAADKTVEQAKAGKGVARAGYLPTFAGFASYSINGTSPFKKTLKDQRVYGVQATWDLFDNNVTHSQVKQAETNIGKAQDGLEALKEGIELEANQAYLSMKAAEKNISTTEVAEKKATEDYKISQMRYSAGVGTNLDVIDARVALTAAQTNHIKALYDYNVSRAQLIKVMGMPVDTTK